VWHDRRAFLHEDVIDKGDYKMDGLTTGRMVHYVLSYEDAKQINRRRTDSGSIHKRMDSGTWPEGAQAHIGNAVDMGEHVPAVIVYVWSDSGMVNLKCLLDGNDDYWASSIPYESGEPPVAPSIRTWHWIEKA
jgi:hypothetical protein